MSIKNRAAVLAEELENELFRVLGGAANVGRQSRVVGGVADHVYMLFQLGRTVAIADTVGKTNENCAVNDTGDDLDVIPA